MPTYVATDTVKLLASSFQGAYQVRNISENNIYLADQTDVSPINKDWTLAPGDRLGFVGDRDIWMITETGKTASIEVQLGASGSFTPAPAEFSIDYSAVLLAEFATVNPHSGTTTVTLTEADLGSSAGLLLQIGGNNNSLIATVAQVTVQWANDAGTFEVTRVQAGCSLDATMLWTTPRLTNHAVITIVWNSTTSVMGGYIYGLATAAESYVHNYNLLASGIGFGLLAGVFALTQADPILDLVAECRFTKLTGITNYRLAVPSIAGPMDYFLNNLVNIVSYGIRSLAAPTNLYYKYYGAGTTFALGSFIAGRWPIEFEVNQGASAGGEQGAITMIGVSK